jgi:hypothetical protein
LIYLSLGSTRSTITLANQQCFALEQREKPETKKGENMSVENILSKVSETEIADAVQNVEALSAEEHGLDAGLTMLAYN